MKKLVSITTCICLIIILCSVTYANFFTSTINSAKAGNTKRLEKQLKSGDKNKNQIVEKAMEYAIIYNRPKTVKLLLKYLDSPNSVIGGKNTPLQLVSAYGYNEIVKILIDNGADVNHTGPREEDKIFNNPLAIAMNNQKYDTAKILIENGSNINYCDFFFDAAKKFKEQGEDLIKFCVSKGFDIKGNFGSSAVEFAVYYKDRKLFDYLLKNGALPSDWSLVRAADNKDISIIGELCKSRYDIKLRTGLYALMHAITTGDDKTVEYLLKSGVPIKLEETTSGIYSQYPIGEAVEQNNYHALQMLLEKGADINAEGMAVINRPLYRAVENCNLKMVRFLLERGADVKIKGTSETLLFDNINDVKKNRVDWFDFQHKRDCDKILKLLHKYKNK